MRRPQLKIMLTSVGLVLLGGAMGLLAAGRPGTPGAPGATGGVLGTTAGSEEIRQEPSVAPPLFGQKLLESDPVEPRYARGRILVGFEDSARPAAIQGALERTDADVARKIAPIDVAVLDVDPADMPTAMAALKASPAVEYAEREVVMESLGPLTPNDMLWQSQWGLKLVEADHAWATTTGGSGVVVAVVDTGVDASHPDLAGAVIPGHDFVGGDADASDDNGHGTAAAGVIAARGNNAEGPAGMCWACSILPVKVLDAQGTGPSATVAAGIVWAVDRGARVINLSLGAPTTTQVLTDAIAYAAEKGAVLVSASGNSGTSTPFYPAAYPQVVSVAGTTSADVLYDWSNRGSWVDVGAPGCNPAPVPAGGYVEFCGTSSASPVVAGIAALALAARSTTTRAEIENAIQSSAVPLGQGTEVRYGRVRAAHALVALGVQPPQPASAPPVPRIRTARATFRSTLRGWTRTRRFSRVTNGGRVTLQLVARTQAPVTLSIRNASGRVVSRVEGRTPLRLVRRLPRGRYTFSVSSRRDTPFTLVAFYPVRP